MSGDCYGIQYTNPVLLIQLLISNIVWFDGHSFKKQTRSTSNESKYSDFRQPELCTPIRNIYRSQRCVKICPFEAFLVLLQMYARLVSLLDQRWSLEEHKVTLTEIHPWRLYITELSCKFNYHKTYGMYLHSWIYQYISEYHIVIFKTLKGKSTKVPPLDRVPPLCELGGTGRGLWLVGAGGGIAEGASTERTCRRDTFTTLKRPCGRPVAAAASNAFLCNFDNGHTNSIQHSKLCAMCWKGHF